MARRRDKKRAPLNPMDVVMANPYFAMVTSHPGPLGVPDERNLYVSPSGQVAISNKYDQLIITGFDLEFGTVMVEFDAEGAMISDFRNTLIDLFLRQNDLLVPLRKFRLMKNLDLLLDQVVDWECEVDVADGLDAVLSHTTDCLDHEVQRLMPDGIEHLMDLDDEVREAIAAFVDRWSDHIKPMVRMPGRSVVAPN